MTITVTCWGCRGSIPTGFTEAALRQRLRATLIDAGPGDVGSAEAADRYLATRRAAPIHFGGETTCAEIANSDGGRVLIDFGSGARAAGLAMARTAAQAPITVLMTHLHWDHVQAFPFFAPLHIPGAALRILGGHGEGAIESALRHQFDAPYFPVPFSVTQAATSFGTLTADAPVALEGFTVTPHLLRHGGDSYGYRFEFRGASVVFASDAEHDTEDVRADHPYARWIADADLLVFDAQYSLADAVSIRADWGHSSSMIGVEYAHLADVKSLLLTHHDPLSSDAAITAMLRDACRFEALNRPEGRAPLTIDAAYDGMRTQVGGA